jgi:enterochelin esterase-like enzyme
MPQIHNRLKWVARTAGFAVCGLSVRRAGTALYVGATHPESGGKLAANSPPQMRRGGAPSAGVVLNGW